MHTASEETRKSKNNQALSRLMERARRWLRAGVTTLFGVSLVPVMNLNVERLAEDNGWDRLLSSNFAWLISAMSSITENPLFLVILGATLGGTLFMWIDYFVRQREPVPAIAEAAVATIQLSPEQIADFGSDIDRAMAVIEASEDGVSIASFHESAAICMKLMKAGVPTPLRPEYDDYLEYEEFNRILYDYLLTIRPYVRSGDLVTLKYFAQTAIDIIMKGRHAPQPSPNLK